MVNFALPSIFLSHELVAMSTNKNALCVFFTSNKSVNVMLTDCRPWGEVAVLAHSYSGFVRHRPGRFENSFPENPVGCSTSDTLTTSIWCKSYGCLTGSWFSPPRVFQPVHVGNPLLGLLFPSPRSLGTGRWDGTSGNELRRRSLRASPASDNIDTDSQWKQVMTTRARKHWCNPSFASGTLFPISPAVSSGTFSRASCIFVF